MKNTATPINCPICGGYVTNSSRTYPQKERAYAVHTGIERHRRALQAMLEADNFAGLNAIAMTFAKSPGPKDVLNDH